MQARVEGQIPAQATLRAGLPRAVKEEGDAGASASSSSSKRPFVEDEHVPAGILRLGKKHRLPPATNAVVKVEPVDRVGPSAGTRSQSSQPPVS